MMIFVILGLIFGSALAVAIGQHFQVVGLPAFLLGFSLSGLGALVGACVGKRR